MDTGTVSLIYVCQTVPRSATLIYLLLNASKNKNASTLLVEVKLVL
jgi:hypothetical protein